MVCAMTATEKSNRAQAQRGATGQKLRIADRWRGYRAHHRATLSSSLVKMLGEPIQTLMTVLVIAIALALPSAMLLLLNNVQKIGGDLESSSQITVFVAKPADSEAVDHLAVQLEELKGVISVTYVSAEQALEEFKALSGFGAALRHLDENPLPAVFLVQPLLSGEAGVSQAERLMASIEGLESVEDVQVDMLWIQRLNAITEIGEKLVLAISLALGIGVLLIVGNTIRLAIQGRQEEIIVVKLVGGTDAYVRRPFLYTGTLLGLFGALIASLMLIGCLIWVGRSVEVLASLYQSQFELVGLGLSGVLVLCGIGAMTGLIGAWIAVMQHLRKIQPK
jgi:cell division transport system permease protein